MKYVPMSGWWDDARGVDYIPRTIHEEERKPIDTGLLNKDGVKLYRVEERQPIGFYRPTAAALPPPHHRGEDYAR